MKESDFVKISVEDLGFENGATAEQVLKRIKELGCRLPTKEEIDDLIDGWEDDRFVDTTPEPEEDWRMRTFVLS